MAFPTQWLVIRVPVALICRVKKTHGSRSGQTLLEPLVARQGWNLDCHARMTLVAFVVAARRDRTQPAFLLKKKVLHIPN